MTVWIVSHVKCETALAVVGVHHARVVHQVVVDVTAVLIHLSEVGVQLQIVLAFVKDYWLARVEAQHVILACFKCGCCHDLGGVRCNSS